MPLLLGVTADDGLGAAELEWTMLPPPITTPSEYEALLTSYFGEERAADALRAFPVPAAAEAAEVKKQLGVISEALWCGQPSSLTLTHTITPSPSPLGPRPSSLDRIRCHLRKAST
jgi:hypothetical protein